MRIFAAFILLLLPKAVFSQTSGECTLEAAPIHVGTSLGRSWEERSHDGDDGADIFRFGTSITYSPRARNLTSFEVLDSRNDVFTTVIIDAEIILSAEQDEIEVVTDWFDQVILDPRYKWSATVDPAFTGQLFTTEHNDRVLTVRTGLHTYVINGSEPGLVTKVGPFGSHGEIWNINRTEPTVSIPQASENDVSLHWAGEGIIIPDLRTTSDENETIELNTQNEVQNSVVIDLKMIIGKKERDLVLRTDPIDRLILVQEPCWDIGEVDSNGLRQAFAIQNLPQRLSLTAQARQLQAGRISSFAWANVHRPGYRHLSVESRMVLDAIKLDNGGVDVLVIRNTGHLRRDSPVLIMGDPGLDEVWLEGSAGWRTEFRDTGVVATVPADNASQIELHFGPGIKLKILPIPKFLGNPAILELPFYPGNPNRKSQHATLYVSRGGYVALSANQLANKRHIGFINGAPNIVRISPEQLSNSAESVELNGEHDLDMLLLDEMPEGEVDHSGAIIWQIDRPDGVKQRVKATGFSYVTRLKYADIHLQD